MEALVSAFHLDIKIIIAQLINFAVVFFVLYKFALKPLGKLMEERKQKIAQGVEDAHINAKLIEEAKALYDAELARAKEEAQKLLISMKEEVGQKRIVLLEEAKNDAQTIVTSTRKELEEEKNQILRDAQKEIAILVLTATEKVLGTGIDTKTKEALVEQSIKGL
jgi:F-type H+-transporting ATPase subunit b